MAIIKGKPKRQSGYKLTQDLLSKIDVTVESGEFPNKTAVVEAALREFFTKKELDIRIQDQVKTYLESEEGKKLIRDAISG